METSLFTVKIGPTVFHCPECRTLLHHYCQPVNVHVYACPACKKVYDPVYVRGFEDGLAAHAAQQGVQSDELKPCVECGALGYSHRPSCSKFGSYVVSTRR